MADKHKPIIDATKFNGDCAAVRKDRGMSTTSIVQKNEKDAITTKLRPLTAPVCDEQLREKFNKSVSVTLGLKK